MTKADVIARFTVACSDCDSTTAASLFDEAHQQLCRKFEVFDSAQDLNTIADERLLPLPSIIVKIVNVNYKPSADAGGWTQILPTTSNELDFYENFRKDTDTAIPTRYYFGAYLDVDGQSTNAIVFDKLFPTSTSGGYPKVTVSGQFLIPLTDTSNLPEALIGYEMVYVYHMAKSYTSIVAPEKMAYWDDLLRSMSSQVRADLMSKEYSIEGTSLLPAFVNRLPNARAW